MKLDSLEKLFVHQLKDLFSAENQIVDAMPQMIDAISDDELRTSFEDHLAETKTQIARLEEIFSKMDFGPHGERCQGAAGLIEEAKGLLKADTEPPVLDAGLVAAAQRIEHYEMAGYGCAVAFAEKLGNQHAADLLRKTLDEEAAANRNLTRLAERSLNFEALVA